MAETNITTERSGSIVKRFNSALLLLYLLAIVVTTPGIYYVTEAQVNAQAQQELSLLVKMVKSIQGYIAKEMRPYFIQHNLFYSPGFSGIVATSLIARDFIKEQPGYYIKTVSDNPLNPANAPQALEIELMERFRQARGLTQWTQVGVLNGKIMLISAAPKVSKSGCLRCHGSAKGAPEEIRTKYPGFRGYNYQPDEVVGVSIVAVPMENVQALVWKRTSIVLVVLTVLFGVILAVVNLLVRSYLLKPILEITGVAHAISHGTLNKDKRIELDRNDEIGDLARSVELVRRSFEKLMQRMYKH